MMGLLSFSAPMRLAWFLSRDLTARPASSGRCCRGRAAAPSWRQPDALSLVRCLAVGAQHARHTRTHACTRLHAGQRQQQQQQPG